MASVFKLNEFQSQVLGTLNKPGAGLARTNRFEVFINPPPALQSRGYGRLVSLYVEQASIPLFNIFVKPFKIFGPTYQRPVTSEYGGEGLPITFHVDRDFNVKRFFEDWMHLIVNEDDYTVSYQNQYASDILIRQLDEKENITYEVLLLEAFPRNLNLMELNNNSQNQTHRLNVLFAYRYWKRNEAKQIETLPRVLRNPEVPAIDNTAQTPGFSWSGDNIGDYVETGGTSSLPPSA